MPFPSTPREKTSRSEVNTLFKTFLIRFTPYITLLVCSSRVSLREFLLWRFRKLVGTDLRVVVNFGMFVSAFNLKRSILGQGEVVKD